MKKFLSVALAFVLILLPCCKADTVVVWGPCETFQMTGKTEGYFVKNDEAFTLAAYAALAQAELCGIYPLEASNIAFVYHDEVFFLFLIFEDSFYELAFDTTISDDGNNVLWMYCLDSENLCDAVTLYKFAVSCAKSKILKLEW